MGEFGGVTVKVIFRHPNGMTVTQEVDQFPVLVGRAGGGADLQLADRCISARHGRLWADEQGCWYEDVGSRHGSWYQGQRLEAALLLQVEQPVILGETLLNLLITPRSLPQGMELRSTGQVGSQGLSLALSQQEHGQARLYLDALYGLTEGLLRSEGWEFFPEAVKRIRQAVPVAQSIALIGWPENLTLAGEAESVSSTLLHYAVEQARPLLLSSGNLPEVVANSASVRLHGIHSAAYIPLQPEARVSAVLCVDSPNCALPLNELDFQFLCAVAGLLTSKLASDALRQQARQQLAQQQLAEARREALAGFLQIASHDLKNPLMAIQNCARLLARVGPERQPPILEILWEASHKAYDLIRTYLDAAALEGGRPLEILWERLDLAKLVNDEIQFLRAALREQVERVRFDTQVQGGIILADGRKLRQVLSNLLSNAIKYSPQGGAVGIVSQLQGGVLRLEVSDQGVGISESDQARLFGAFERVGDRALASGNGLGLWLTAALIRAHGGEIGVESHPGQGSRFWCTIPQEGL